MFLPQMMGIEMSQRRVARGAFVFELELVVGIEGHLMDHLGTPKRILRAVGHQ